MSWRGSWTWIRLRCGSGTRPKPGTRCPTASPGRASACGSAWSGPPSTRFGGTGPAQGRAGVSGWPPGGRWGERCRPRRPGRADSDGKIYVQVGSVDITGTRTAMALIAAEVIGVRPTDVRVVAGDTAQGPFAGPAGGSMVTYTVGASVAEAAAGVAAQIREVAAELLEASPDDLEIKDGEVSVRGSPESSIPIARVARATEVFGSELPPILAHGRVAQRALAPGFTVQLAEIRVDEDTGQIGVERLVVIQDVGKAISPALVRGQIHGGAVQGIGWALQEELAYDEDGQLLTGSFMGYAVPDAPQVPEIESILVENPAPTGPMGARGVGEPPIVAGPAAIANAVRDAVGVRMTDLPMTPARVWAGLRGRRH